jgi:hypothetical protein
MDVVLPWEFWLWYSRMGIYDRYFCEPQGNLKTEEVACAGVVAPFQGAGVGAQDTQGVALGYQKFAPAGHGKLTGNSITLTCTITA